MGLKFLRFPFILSQIHFSKFSTMMQMTTMKIQSSRTSRRGGFDQSDHSPHAVKSGTPNPCLRATHTGGTKNKSPSLRAIHRGGKMKHLVQAVMSLSLLVQAASAVYPVGCVVLAEKANGKKQLARVVVSSSREQTVTSKGRKSGKLVE